MRSLRWVVAALVLGSVLVRSTAGAAPAARGERVRLPAVSVAGAPRSLVTLVVPVPSDLVGAAGTVHYEVQITGGVDVLGRLEGVLDRTVDQRFRPVLLTLRVPSDALVGLLDVADVVFRTADGRIIEVPIILRVPAVQAIRVTGVRELRELERGDRVELVYRVQNLGNDVERLNLQVLAPPDWTVRAREGESITVDPYGWREVTLAMRVPPAPRSGSHIVELALSRSPADTAAVARARTSLRVRELLARPEGVVVQPFVGAAATSAGSGLITGLRLAGPLTERMHLRGEFAPRPTVDGLGVLGLGTVGAVQMPFNAALSTEDWELGVGNAQANFGDLTGVNIFGRGATFTARGGDRQALAIAARPAVEFGGRGHFVGAGAWWNTAYGRVGGSFSSLAEQYGDFGRGRELRALGADWVSRPLGSAVVSAGLALRDAGAEVGLGYRAAVEHETARDRLRVTAMHAPGGQAAFAMASDQVQLDASRVLTDRFFLTANGSWTRDVSGVFSSLENRALSLGGRYRVADRTMLGIRVADDAASASSSGIAAGSFGTGQRSAIGSVETAAGAWRLSADTRVARLQRSSTLFSGAVSEREALQQGVGVNATRAIPQLGAVALGGSYTRTGAGVGAPPSFTSAFARWSEVPFRVAGEIVRAETEVRVIQSSLERARIGIRAGLASTLRSGLDVATNVERNPFLRDARGRELWILALRISASRDVLPPTRLETQGVVFQDLNGNGRRDPGEEGIPGVALLYDRMRFSTARDGRYRVPASVRGRLAVDPASIPHGYVQHPKFALDSIERREIPLLPTASMPIVLELQPDADGRLPDVDFSVADVWLRDAEGFEWVGRHGGSGRFTFEHVPVGTYTLRVGFSRVRQPVRTDDVTLTLRAGDNAAVVVPVRGRSVRIITPPRNEGRTGVGPRGGRGA